MRKDRFALPTLLLLLTVLVPSAGVMWMMREAVRNEQAATNQRLHEAYRLQLDQAAARVVDDWQTRLARRAKQVVAGQAAKSFAQIVATDAVDSAVICDSAGNIAYPKFDAAKNEVNALLQPTWKTANRLEFVESDFEDATKMYQEIFERSEVANERMSALLAIARTQEKAGFYQEAIESLKKLVALPVKDVHSEAYTAAAMMRLLQLLDQESSDWIDTADSLEKLLGDYQRFSLRSSQRVFLMKEFQRLTKRDVEWSTRSAELLALEFVGQVDGIKVSNSSSLTETSVPNVWQEKPEGHDVVSLYRTETLRSNILEVCKQFSLPTGVSFSVTPPDELSENLMDVSLGPMLGDWQLGLEATGEDPFNQSSKYQNGVYVWIAALTVAATCVLAWFLLASLRRRMKLAQLKNDLVATVSHELKTPLASIRLLVDTLLQNSDKENKTNQQQTGEYLQLISAENARLTRLIDNFLTFSRMERGQQRFDFSDVDLCKLLEQAASVFRDNCPGSDKFLTVRADDSALVLGDKDSLVTAIVNLLENAWKYSEEQRRIELTADIEDVEVAISVADNGIGLTPRQIDRVFDRFYQVDQRVARTREGCGLGLSIVRSIVESHGGTITVTSRPEVGSTFTIRLPRVK